MNNDKLYLLFGVLVLCNVFDITATSYLLQHNAEEVNPVANYVITNTGFAGLGLIKGLLLGFLLHAIPAISRFPLGEQLFKFAVVGYIALTAWHLHLISLI